MFVDLTIKFKRFLDSTAKDRLLGSSVSVQLARGS